jgi:predicted NBD/HSP70 family sugar kinase
MVQPLKEKFGVPVNLGNDVNVATIGIVVFGEGAKYGNPDDVNYTGVGVTHGTGYGVGVWSRRGIVWGVDGNAAEGGHFRIDKDGARCGCGNYGCAETLGSGSGSAWRARELLVRNRFDSEIFERARDASKAHSKRDINMNPYLILGDVDSKLVFEVYEDNPEDRVAGQVVREVGKAIGRSYGIIAGAYNTSFIANFGSMTNDWGHLEDIVMDELKASCNVRVPDVFTTKLGSNVGLKGALGYAMGKGE